MLHAQTCTRFEQKSTKLNPILFNQKETLQQMFMISTTLNLMRSIWKSLIPFWQRISTYFQWQRVWQVVNTVQIQRRESRELLMNAQRPLYILVVVIPGYIDIKLYHQVNNVSRYADGYHHSIIDNMDGQILPPLIMYTCTVLRHTILG